MKNLSKKLIFTIGIIILLCLFIESTRKIVKITFREVSKGTYICDIIPKDCKDLYINYIILSILSMVLPLFLLINCLYRIIISN